MLFSDLDIAVSCCLHVMNNRHLSDAVRNGFKHDNKAGSPIPMFMVNKELSNNTSFIRRLIIHNFYNYTHPRFLQYNNHHPFFVQSLQHIRMRFT